MKDKHFNCTYYNCNLRSYLFATGFYWESLYILSLVYYIIVSYVVSKAVKGYSGNTL